MNPNHCQIKTYNMPIFISFEQVSGGGGGGLVEAKPIDASGKTAATSSYSGDIVNHYTYQGRKLGKKVYNSQHTLTVDEEYYDELMFSFGKPSRISHGDGYIALSDNGGATFYYYLKDHLGNVRSVILPDANNQPVVSQANDYFPFGMSFESTLPNPGIRANYNKLKYNGKEEQEMPGKWLDYGARFYDPSLARFHTIDPRAESYYAWSPYNYTGGNPIARVDVNGEFWGTVVKAAKSAYKVGKKVYKTYKKTGKIDAKSIKKAGVDELYDIVDNVKTLADGQLTADDAFAAIDLVTGFGSEAKKASKALGIIDDAGDAKKASKYEDVTKASRGKESTKNIKTDVSKSDFESNLESGGFEKTVSKDGKANNYTKDGNKYSIREKSKDFDGPSADYKKAGSEGSKPDLKIRLQKDNQ